jgi:hypothetical protein
MQKEALYFEKNKKDRAGNKPQQFVVDKRQLKKLSLRVLRIETIVDF